MNELTVGIIGAGRIAYIHRNNVQRIIANVRFKCVSNPNLTDVHGKLLNMGKVPK
ncbi:MAG: hypothetical protein WCY53_07290 [Sphaerochaetaceae bacterium]